MTARRERMLTWLVFGALLLALLAMAALTAPIANAGGDLPPRDKPTATPVPEDDDDDEIVGGYIQVLAGSLPAGAWISVQWQGEGGLWHTVEGWQGSASQRWWVHPKDFGDGPFRWIATEGKDGAELAVSDSFMLPSSPNEVVTSSLSQ